MPDHIDVYATGVDPARTAALITEIKAIPGVDDAAVSANAGNAALIAVTRTGEAHDESARKGVRAIRALPPPPGVSVGVTGQTADLVNKLDGIGKRFVIWPVP